MFPVESQGAVDIVSPGVALNHENADELVESIAMGLGEGQPMVVVDMSGVPLVDSAVLESLLDIQQTLRSKGGAVKLAGLSQLCQDILRATDVAKHFDTYRDVKEAVRSFVR